MNIKKLKTWSIIGVFIIMTLAALWHFIYARIPSDFSAVIFPVNESPWEHIKLFFFPVLIFYVVQYMTIGKKFKNFVFAHGISLLVMPLIMFGMFYGYRLGLKIPERLIFDIIITFITICLGSFIGYKITVSQKDFSKKGFIAIIIATVFFAVTTVFTFFTPEVPLFYDKNTQEYGIPDEPHDHDEH